MLVPLTPFLWSTIQVSLLALAALAIVKLLRGRFPQWASAMLAGSSLSALLLTVMIWLPQTQWSLTNHTVANTGRTFQQDSKLTTDSAASASAFSMSPTTDMSGELNEQFSNLPLASDESGKYSENHQALIAKASEWFSRQLQQVDDQVRQYEVGGAQQSQAVFRLQFGLLVVLALLSGLWLSSWLFVRRIIANSRPIDDTELMKKLNAHAARFGLAHIPELRISNQIAVGATVGCRKRWLILSEDWKSWSADEIDAVLLHELAHVIRHDYLWVVMGSWIRVLFFYHPLMHLIVRCWRIEQELAADQLAAGAMRSAGAYGRALASLALRSQSKIRVSGPVLTADQICIVRRVTMLKQGSLKPSRHRWGWTALVTALTVASLLPLSGLRGKQTDDDLASAKVTTEVQEGSATSDGQRQRATEFEEVQKAFPPLEVVGRLKWSPGNLISDDVSPAASYLQDLSAFALFEQFPENAEVQCPATFSLRWSDMEREHGDVVVGAMANESHGIDGKLLARLLTNSLLGSYKKSAHTKTIAGRNAVGLVRKVWNADLNLYSYEEEPSKWFVQDNDEFYYGTEEDVAERIYRSVNKTADEPLIEIPSEFQQDYSHSALSLVYADCDQWYARIRKHFDGSPKRAEVALVYPFLDGLKQIGLFVTSENGTSVTIRVRYNSDKASETGAKALKALIELAKANDPADPLVSRVINSLSLKRHADEVVVKLEDPMIWQIACNLVLPEKRPGWTDILGEIVPAQPSENVPGEVESGNQKGSEVVKFACVHPFASAGFLAQSLRANVYHGKRVRVSAELGCDEELQERSGVIIWTSDDKNASTGNSTSGNSIGNPIDTTTIRERLESNKDSGSIVWRRQSVELDVAEISEVLSFGVYTAGGELLVRNVKFEVVGPAYSAEQQVSLAKLPRNLLHVPGRKLLDKPTNLDFSQTGANPDSDSSVERSAESKDNGSTKR